MFILFCNLCYVEAKRGLIFGNIFFFVCGEKQAYSGNLEGTGVSVQFSSVAQSCLTLCDPMNGSSPGLQLRPSPTPGVHPNPCPLHQWCYLTISSSATLFSFCLQSFPASRSFPVSQLFTWDGLEYWSFSFSIIPSKEIPGLISFRRDWLDLLAIQGTLKSLLQHHSSKA